MKSTWLNRPTREVGWTKAGRASDRAARRGAVATGAESRISLRSWTKAGGSPRVSAWPRAHRLDLILQRNSEGRFRTVGGSSITRTRRRRAPVSSGASKGIVRLVGPVTDRVNWIGLRPKPLAEPAARYGDMQ